MRFYLTLLLIVVKSQLFAQFSDDFSDGNFTNNPIWTGQTANFLINTSQELQLDAPSVTDTSYLSTAATNIDNTTWDFYLRMDFNPSSSNYARVYLVSDNSNLKSNLNGYFVEVGGTADEISLYRQDGNTVVKIIDGIDNSVDMSVVESRIRVTRDGVGNWELFRDTTAAYNFVSEGTVMDATYTSTNHFGAFCRYTSTRSDKFFFDDIGNPYVDTIKPVLDTLTVISGTELDLQFSESLDQLSAETITNYTLDNGAGNPVSATIDATDPSLVHLAFAANFISGTDYELTVNNVEDIAGNTINSPTTYSFFYFEDGVAQFNDIIITEFMADPSPSVGLPEVEYVELFNRSDKYFDLSGWTITDATSSATFSSYVLGPAEYVLICNNGDCGQFFVPNSTELSMPSLNNSSDIITIRDDFGITVDSISFTDEWHSDDSKKDGGWSIERRHMNTQCNDKSNWGSSVDTYGGTPALQNSIWTDQDDIVPAEINEVSISGDSLITIEFNEYMDTTMLPLVSIAPAINNIDWQWIDVYTLIIETQTLMVNQPYELHLEDYVDCWGNVGVHSSILIGLPDSVEKGDLLINEVMFNPLTGGSDYVELYNFSEKIIDLNDLYLANWDDDSISNYKPITTAQELLFPTEYILVTEDTNDIINDFSIYGVGRLLESDLPTYPNDSGTVFLMYGFENRIDYFHYDENYHFDLLDSEDGKALERISFEGASNDPNNWHTAAENVDWGTPGYENSQSVSNSQTGEVSLETKIFSPDNDGYQDVLTISFNLQSIDNVVDIEIYDNHGRLIRELKDNYFIGNKASINWDGINDEGEKAAVGSYIILVSITDVSGNQEQHKLVAVLASKL